MENKDYAPPSTPYYNQSLDLPDWNEGLKLLSPNLPRHTPARLPWKMGPPLRTPQAKKPTVRTPAMAASAQRLPCGPTPANTPVHGTSSMSGPHPKTPGLSSFPNALSADFWLTRAKAKEDEGDILGALGVLENALRRNARPFSPLTKAISRLQTRMQEPRAAAARLTPVKFWSSLRPAAADKEKKKTLRFAGQADEDNDGQELQGDSMAAGAKMQDSQDPDAARNKERTPHVRFYTPAPEANRPPKSPMHSRSSNAGSTPFHSSGSRQRMSDFSDDSDDADISDSGSPTTVSRRLLEPVLMETIRNMNACKLLQEKGCYGEKAEMDGHEIDGGPAESHMSESDCMGGMHRYLLESEMSPNSGAVKVPFQGVNSYSMHADASTPHGMRVSPISETAEADEDRACGDKFSFDSLIPAATPDLNLHATPNLRARPAILPQGNITPSVCINPLYASTRTPSTANSDAPNTAAYTPAAPADPIFYANPATAAATPLLSAVAAKSLFYAAPVSAEEPEASTDPEAYPVQPAVDQGRPDAKHREVDEVILQPPAALTAEEDTAAIQSQPIVQEATANSEDSTGMPAADAPDQATAEGAEESPADAADVNEDSALAPGSPVAQQPALTQQDFVAARRAFPRTPASAVRRSRPEDCDAPTPICNPLRVATPARARPPVGMSEIRSLLQDPHAPSPAQAATLGSRNALSPMRAAPKMRTGLGHAQLVTPKRRSARKPAATAPQSTGKMLAAAGFAYTPNAALAGRLAAAADGRPVLGDAMDSDLLASMDEVADSEGTPVILDASQLEELAAVMCAVSLTPSLEAACRSRSNTPEPHISSGNAPTAMPSAHNGETEMDTDTTPSATLAGPMSSMRVTRSALRKSQPPPPAGGADAAGAAAEEGAESEQEGTPSFKEAPRPQSARVTRSAAKALQHTPAPAASAVASSKGATGAPEGEDASSKSSKQMSPTERTIRQGLRRSTRLA